MGRVTETHIAVAIITMVTVNVGGETKLYTTDFDAWTYESEVNLTLIGLRLTKYIDLKENRAAENYSGFCASIPKLRNSS